MRIDVSEYIGKTNNRLTVTGYSKPEKGRVRLICRCVCGNETRCLPYQFSSGDVKSCGCAREGNKYRHDYDNGRKTHGLSKHPFYKKWNDMVRRCHNEREPAYRYYGALGIEVCEEWRNSPAAFIKWCEETYPGGEKTTLDRIDGKGGYSPQNCRWATPLEQSHNLKTNRFITIGSETRCVTEWASKHKLSPGSIYKRVKKGQTFEQAISELIEKKKAT